MSEEQRDFNEAAMSGMLEKLIGLRLEERIAGNRKSLHVVDRDSLVNIIPDDGAIQPLEFRHASFNNKYPSANELKEAIEKFIEDVGDYGDTIIWRVKPELCKVKTFQNEKTEYAAYFRFSVGYMPQS